VTVASAVPEMIAGVEAKMGHATLTTPLLGVVCHP